jgi:hypothetical protein
MVIFLDIKRQIVKIYTEHGIQTLEFDNINMLPDIMGGRKALYVTNAMTVSSEDIVSTIKGIKKQIVQKRVDSGEIMYLRNATFGALTIPDLYNRATKEKEDLTFRSSTEAKVLNDFYRDYGKDIFETSPIMRNLLKNGKIQIVTEGELKEINKKIKSGKLKKYNSKEESRADIKKYLKTLSRDEAEQRIELGEIGSGGGPSSSRGLSNFGNEKTLVSEIGDTLEEGQSEAVSWIKNLINED